MANDLLTHDGRNGSVTRVYRHDAESLYWVLIWILGRFRNGNLIDEPSFKEWKNATWQKIPFKREEDIRKLERDATRRAEFFAGVDKHLRAPALFLRMLFDKASNQVREFTQQTDYFKTIEDDMGLTMEQAAELKGIEPKLEHYSSLSFIGEVFEDGFFGGSQEREKASALLRNKFVFDAAIEACSAPRSRY
uniref:Fungal-type protein kinase domain-containing protein n=1 Tax=Moniliophthora roreri TaxID=221103 RepID=A0A0W0FWZ0_MONRR